VFTSRMQDEALDFLAATLHSQSTFQSASSFQGPSS
jgi:hypothetical protein